MDNNKNRETDLENGYLQVDQFNKESTSSISSHYKDILRHLGEDPEREEVVKNTKTGC